MWMSSKQDPLCTPPTEESGPLANNATLTGYEPNFFDDYHYSETTEIFLQEQSSDTRPSYLCMTRRLVTTPSAERSLHHCSLRSEKNQRAVAYHSLEESLLPAQSLSVCHARTGRPVHEPCSLSSSVRENPSRDLENEQIRILPERQKEQILADFMRAEIRKHEFQADSVRRSIQELNGIIESQRREIDHTLACDEQLRRNQQLLHEQLSEQNPGSSWSSYEKSQWDERNWSHFGSSTPKTTQDDHCLCVVASSFCSPWVLTLSFRHRSWETGDFVDGASRMVSGRHSVGVGPDFVGSPGQSPRSGHQLRADQQFHGRRHHHQRQFPGNLVPITTLSSRSISLWGRQGCDLSRSRHEGFRREGAGCQVGESLSCEALERAKKAAQSPPVETQIRDCEQFLVRARAHLEAIDAQRATVVSMKVVQQKQPPQAPDTSSEVQRLQALVA